MTIDHVFVDILAEQAVDVVEDLRLGDPAARLLTKYSRMRRSRRGSGSTSPATSGSRPPEKTRNSPTRLPSLCPLARPRMARMRARILRTWIGLRTTSSTPAANQIERLVQRFGVVHGDHRRLRAPADQLRKPLAAGIVAKQKGFDRAHVRFGHALNPVCRNPQAKGRLRTRPHAGTRPYSLLSRYRARRR
jgi:hypothetical protein